MQALPVFIWDGKITEKHIRVASPSSFLLELRESAMAGYLWEVASIDTKQGDIVAALVESHSVAGNLDGAENRRSLTFSVQGQGVVSLCLQLKRPWEENYIEEVLISITANTQ